MAGYESIKGSPMAAFSHCLRERQNYINEDIDQARSHLNYAVSPKDHGRSTHECMDYYEQLAADVYHRGGSTITAGQWVVTAPDDLPMEREKEFFQCSYDFLNDYFYHGDDRRCLLAQIHMDESEIGRSHMHYIMAMPETENRKYISMEEKLLDGLKKTQERFGMKLTKEQAKEILTAVNRYEMSALSSRERYAIRDISEVLDLKRDDARWVFTRVRRLESERFEKRLMSKDEFLTKDVFSDLHPAYQRWMKDHGFDCTVYKGGNGVKLSVAELKKMTKDTGYRLVDGTEYERLQSRVAELEHTLQEKERGSTWGSPGQDSSREWGKRTEWGRDSSWTRE